VHISTSPSALAALLLGAALAAGQSTPPAPPSPDLEGQYEVTGQYSNGRAMEADVTVYQAADGLRVARTSRFTGPAFAGAPEASWASDEVVALQPRVWRATFRLGGGGLAGGVSGASSATNVLLGYYVVSADGQRLREIVVNTTRQGAEDWWVWSSARGERLDPFTAKAKGSARALASFIMEYRTDVADYYEPGDEDYYRADGEAAEAFFAGADWVVAAPPGTYPAHRALRAVNPEDPHEVVEPGTVYVLFDAQARVTAFLYDSEGAIYDDDGNYGPTNPAPTPPTPPTPAPPVNCPPGQGATPAELIAAAEGMSSRLTSFIMNFRTSIADYYDWGDQAHYDADERSAREYFDGAAWVAAPVPAGYQAYRALRAVNDDPDDVILGAIYVLFDCDGDAIEIVYDHEGEVYDTNDS